MSIRLVGLGAMSAPRRRLSINWCLFVWGLLGGLLWVPIVLAAFWMIGWL